ncbi:MAG: M14 family zinc carboxypeptidase [Caldilinea sp.]
MNNKRIQMALKVATRSRRALLLTILLSSVLLYTLAPVAQPAQANAWDRSSILQQTPDDSDTGEAADTASNRVFVPFVSAALPGTASGAAGDEGAETPQPSPYDVPTEYEELALVEFQLPDRLAIDQLVELGADLAEYVRDNPDGTITINAFVTPRERAIYESMGFPAGLTVEDRSTWEAARAEREAAIAAEQAAFSAAESDEVSAASFDPGGEVTIMRVDYFTNYAGRFLAVAARTSLGMPTGGPTLAMAWRTEDGGYGSATNMSKFNDAGQYMYHRVLVRVGAAGSTTPVPAFVRVASSTGATAESAVNDWVAGGLPPLADGFLMDFTTRYMDPTEVHQRINALTAEFPEISEIVNLPYLTNGYQRKSMAVMDSNANILGTPGNTARAVYLESKAWGHEGGNQVQVEFLNPGAANQPLTVSVIDSRITVRLGTSATGAINSTAAQVAAAINAHPEASALVTAYTYAGSAGGTPVLARSLVTLTDGLNAPPSVQRGPFQVQMIRIGKHRDGSKIGVFFYCQQHAREWVTPLVCLETAERLLRNYAIDPLTKSFVDNLDIFIVPSYNPDGAHYSMYDFASQRKNMTRYCSLTATAGMPASRNSWGVDNNRNNGIGSIFDGYAGASTSCTSETYAGPAKYSEPENANEKWIVDTFENIKFSMNIHTYGGYYMWSPGAYIQSGRVTLPKPNIGIEAYFFAGADLVLNRIKEIRGTVVLPERTGPIADVLYSAAGNSADDNWYRKDIIAYSFEAGADRFVSTSTGTQQTAVGFQPNYANEGKFEALEFASGNYGLLETALQYAFDNEPPIAEIVPNGGDSQDPIRATFRYVNEPAIIHYTLDGSEPTLSSPMWEAQGPRRPGQVFLFTQNTMLKWIAKDIKGNVSGVSEAYFKVEKLADFSFTAPSNKIYGDAPFSVNAVASTGQVVTLDSQTPAVCTISGTTVTILNAGDCIARASTQTEPGFGASSATVTIPIDKAVLNYSAGGVVQYSDPIPAVTFSGFKYSDTAAVVSGAPECTPSGLATSIPGNYPVSCNNGTLDAANYVFNYTGGVLTIIAEDARATYAGQQFVSTGSASASTASVNLVATIQDITAVLGDPAYDAYAGDIRMATVSFVNRDAGNAVLCTAGPLQLLDAADSKVGTASCTWTANIGNADSVQYTIGITVGGNYTRNSAEDNTLVTVAKLIPGSIAGGGYLVNQSSGGARAGDAGKRTNFGFTVKNVKSGANFQGNVNIILVSGGRTYQIKSNAINSLVTRAGTGATPGIASFAGRATITDITNPNAPVGLEGNNSLQISLTDHGEPGSSDSIAITLWDKSGRLWFSSNWNGVRTVEQILGGGNLAVR